MLRRLHVMDLGMGGTSRRAAALAALVVWLAGCASTGKPPTPAAESAIPGMGPLPVTALTPENQVAQSAYWGQLYEGDPTNLEVAVNYGRTLRMTGREQQAVKVLGAAVTQHPAAPEALAEYGKALTAAGRTLEGRDYLAQANALDRNNWANLSAEGVALDQLGDHAAAQARYEAALNASPNNPAILNNYALSQARAGRSYESERLLRRSVTITSASVQVRQNLAIVLGLKGDFDEAQRYASADLPPEVVAGNMDYLRDLVGPGGSSRDPWSQLQSLDEAAE